MGWELEDQLTGEISGRRGAGGGGEEWPSGAGLRASHAGGKVTTRLRVRTWRNYFRGCLLGLWRTTGWVGVTPPRAAPLRVGSHLCDLRVSLGLAWLGLALPLLCWAGCCVACRNRRGRCKVLQREEPPCPARTKGGSLPYFTGPILSARKRAVGGRAMALGTVPLGWDGVGLCDLWAQPR